MRIKNKVPAVSSGGFLARNLDLLFHIKTRREDGLNFLIEMQMHSLILYEKSKCLIYTCLMPLCSFCVTVMLLVHFKGLKLLRGNK